MPYSAQYKSFIKDKRGFFSTVKTINEAHKKAAEKEFRFLSNNRMLIEQEFNQLFTVLKKEGKNRKEFWLYCYYCCTMLESYYLSYENNAKVEEYEKYRREIQRFIEGKEQKKKEKEAFLTMLGKKIASDLDDLVNTPDHVSKMRAKVGFLNVCRIYWTFCRLTLTSAFELSKDTQILEKLNKILGKQIDIDKIIKTLEAPNAVFRALSVGFFVARFIMNAGMVLKHTFFPTENEKDLSNWERFSDEIAKRYPDFLNDTVWAVVNGLTNYAAYFHIAAPVAGWITAGFLVFDVGLLLWRRHLAEQEYLTKKSQYLNELHYYQRELAKCLDLEKRALLEEQCKVVHEQMTELEIIWKTKSQTYLFNATAALLLATGFAASMLFTPAILVVGAYAVCTLGVAMYLSDGAFSQYREKALRLEQAEIENKNVNAALAEYQAVRNEFIFTMVKNAVIPGLLIATFAICWQAALVLTAVYLAYELYRAYDKHQQNQPKLVVCSQQAEQIEENIIAPQLV